jgi:hypothetical protein
VAITHDTCLYPLYDEAGEAVLGREDLLDIIQKKFSSTLESGTRCSSILESHRSSVPSGGVFLSPAKEPVATTSVSHEASGSARRKVLFIVLSFSPHFNPLYRVMFAGFCI